METKRLMISLLVLCCTLLAKAQNDVAIATLQHGNTVSVFKGPGALAEALTSAVNGDVITLSQGTFNAAPITKSVSIYGMGFEENKTTGTLKSIITGNLDIGIANGSCSNIHLEGLYLDGSFYLGTSVFEPNTSLTNLTVVKVYARTTTYINANTDDIFFDQCILPNGFYSSPSTSINYKASNLYLRNCYLYGQLRNFQLTDNSITLDHCIYNTPNSDNVFSGTACPIKMIASIYCNNRNAWPPAGSNMEYCLSNNDWITSRTYNPGFNTCYTTNASAWLGIFTDNNENATYSQTRTYELQQPTVWVDDKGNQIGINGGNGWSKVPATPVVKNLSVTPSGTNLNVTYEAEVR
jgi:hypothetical protein